MRVTAEQKELTRRRLVRSAGDLFRAHGFAETTTRAIAQKARLASGTMFNYFRTKEELALAYLTEQAEQAHVEFASVRRPTGSIEEWLFGLLNQELRQFASQRALFANIFKELADPFTPADSPAALYRQQHLAQVLGVIDHFNLSIDAATSWEHLYWSLYLGILSHWSTDPSPNQEATRTLIDNAIFMFLSMLRASPGNIKVWP